MLFSPRRDLSDTSLTNPDLILYVDASATQDPVTGVNHVDLVVVSDNSALVSGPLPHHLSAQAVELLVRFTLIPGMHLVWFMISGHCRNTGIF